MIRNMLEKKRKLKPGEIVPLYYDEAFKIMYANSEHLEILTVLLSKILEVEYEDIVGKITLLPLNVPNQILGEKKCERDVVVSLKWEDNKKDNYQIIMEVNVKKDFYESVMNRNLYYAHQLAGRGVLEGECFDKMDIHFLVNFNTYFINNKRKKVFDKYLLRNEEGDILTKNFKVLNINTLKCYNLWYHNKYQGKFGTFEEDLVLLAASMVTSKQEDFVKILEEVRMKPEIKELMEGVLDTMIKDEGLTERYYDFKEENNRLNQSIINEVQRKSFHSGIEKGIKQNQKEMVFNMYKANIALDIISKCSNLSIQEVEEIIASIKD